MTKKTKKTKGTDQDFLDCLAEISVVSGCEWDDDSKLIIMARFLACEADPLTFERFEKHVQAEADEENIETEPAIPVQCPDCNGVLMTMVNVCPHCKCEIAPSFWKESL